MKKNAEAFLSKTLGNDFLESLGSSLSKMMFISRELALSPILTIYFRVSRLYLALFSSLLVRELSPMQIDEIKEIQIPGKEDTFISVSKHERDSIRVKSSRKT